MPCGRRNAALFVQIKTLERLQETIGQKLSNPHSAPFLALFRVAGRQKDALAGNGVLEQRHEPGEHHAHHDLQKIQRRAVFALNKKLRQHQHAIGDQGQVRQAPAAGQADGVGHRNDGRGPQPRLRVEDQPHGQNGHACQINAEPPDRLLFFHVSLSAPQALFLLL